MADWLKEMQELRGSLHERLHNMGDGYRGLVEKDKRDNVIAGGRRGLRVRFEDERRGIGAGHGLRTEITSGTKVTIRQLLRTHDVARARKSFGALKDLKENLFSIEMPERELASRAQEANNELVECCYFIDLFPVVFFGEPLPEKYPDPDDLCMHPVVFLNGLLDVPSELTKSVGEFLLETPHENFNADLIFTLKGRCVGVCEGLWRFLDEYEDVYGGVINTSRFYQSQYKSKLRRQADGIRRMRESLLEFRERQLK